MNTDAEHAKEMGLGNFCIALEGPIKLNMA